MPARPRREYPACEHTGDFGAPPRRKGKGAGPGVKGTGLLQAKQKRRKLRVAYRIRDAEGRPRFWLEGKRGGKRALKAKRKGAKYTLRLRASRRGWVRLRAEVLASGGEPVRLCHRVKLKRVKGKAAKRWTKAKVRSCR